MGVILSLGFASKPTELFKVPKLRPDPTLEPLGRDPGSGAFESSPHPVCSHGQEPLLHTEFSKSILAELLTPEIQPALPVGIRTQN